VGELACQSLPKLKRVHQVHTVISAATQGAEWESQKLRLRSDFVLPHWSGFTFYSLIRGIMQSVNLPDNGGLKIDKVTVTAKYF
jgi:hypothetical protein